MGRTIKEVFFKDSNHENLEVADVKARSHRAAMPLNPPYPPFKRGELHGITAKTLPLCKGGSRGILMIQSITLKRSIRMIMGKENAVLGKNEKKQHFDNHYFHPKSGKGA